MARPRVVVIMGVAGSGKSTVGRMLAEHHQGKFFDADDFHPAANIAKMQAGVPLNDDDRLPWLERMRAEVIEPAPAASFTVLACSALKRKYRRILGVGHNGVQLVHLHVDPATLRRRLQQRQGHFATEILLESQLASLEAPAPDEGLIVAGTPAPGGILAMIEQSWLE